MIRNGITGLLFLILALSSEGQILTAAQARQSYLHEWQEECGAKDLYTSLKNVTPADNPVLLAYAGAATTTLANCHSSPFRKFGHFTEGRDKIEEAVKKSPENLEIRFIRFTVQSNIPWFLNYDNRDEDKTIILKQLNLKPVNSEEEKLHSDIREYLMKTGVLSFSEPPSFFPDFTEQEVKM